jgi:hypothetical protein
VSDVVPVPVAAFQLACSSPIRASSIWSYAQVAVAAALIASPFRASDSYVSSPRTSRRWAIAVVTSGNAAERTDRETGDGGRRFAASEPLENRGDDGQGLRTLPSHY